MFTIQKETVGSETRFTKAGACLVFVNIPAILNECDSHIVELGTIELPQLDRSKIGECYFNIGTPRRHVCLFRINNTRAIKQLDFHVPRPSVILQKATHLKPPSRAENVYWFREDILDKRLRNNSQRDIAVDTSERQVVNLAPKRRNVLAFSRINFNRNHVVATPVHKLRQLIRERRIPTAILTQTMTIDMDRRRSHDSTKVNKHSLAINACRQLEMPAIK